ncbi:hypothetical protein Tco_0184335 [Tanacetum coccineum]
MSSPNHPTFDIEDAFSSNFPDYIPASPDYVPASPGKTYSSSSNNSFGIIATLRNEVVTDHPVLLFALPQAFDDRRNSYVDSIGRHEEQLTEILNHLDGISSRSL